MPNTIMGAEFLVLQKLPAPWPSWAPRPGGDFRACCALHSNRMVLDETVMARGIAVRYAMAEAMLGGLEDLAKPRKT